jgi:Protein of unknown function (DUF3800)
MIRAGARKPIAYRSPDWHRGIFLAAKTRNPARGRMNAAQLECAVLRTKSQHAYASLKNIWPGMSAKNFREREFLVLGAYFDESHNSQVFLVGALLARGSEIEKLERSWVQVVNKTNLRLSSRGRRPISRYHAAEMNARDNEFEGWSEAESRAFSKKLLRLLRNRHLYVIAWAVVLADMVKVFPDTQSDPRGSAYEYAMWRCLLKVHDEFGPRISEQLRVSGGISVVYDRGDFGIRAFRAFRRIVDEPHLSYRECFDSVAEGNSIAHIALQVADLLVYECFRETRRKLFSSAAEMRKFFKKMVRGGAVEVYVGYSDENDLSQWKEKDRGHSPQTEP